MNVILTLLFTLFIHSPYITQSVMVPNYGRTLLNHVNNQQEADSSEEIQKPTVPLEEEPEFYQDIQPNSWYEAAVLYVLEEEIMIGTTTNAFSPELLSTRGQIATVFFSIENVPYGLYPNIFPDATYQWYQDAANWCAVHEIMFGYSYGDFAGTNPVSRQELAIILYQYQKYLEKDISNTDDTMLNEYLDHSDVVFYAQDAMSWCVNQQLFLGDENYIRPLDFATRAEVAFAIHQLLENTD